MDFLTEKKDAISDRVCRDFPNVRVTEIEDSNIISVISGNQYLFIDSRLDIKNYPDAYVALMANGSYNVLETKNDGYVITYS